MNDKEFRELFASIQAKLPGLSNLQIFCQDGANWHRVSVTKTEITTESCTYNSPDQNNA